jgi:GT2 family glycosyltransferase
VSPDEEPRVAVAVVSYNAHDALGRCLESVNAAGAEEVVVVDNGSTDGSIELVRSCFPRFELRVNEVNLGYGSAANQALAACRAPVVLLLNSDTEIAPGALEALDAYLRTHPRAAIVGPRLLNADRTLQRSTYPDPSVLDVLVGESGMHLVMRRIPLLRERSLRTWDHGRARRVPWVLGAALAIRREAFELVGGFDEDFFLYGEEVDLSRRLLELGHETHFAPVTNIVHIGGASTAARPAAMRRELILGWRRYLEKHGSPGSTRRVLRITRAIVWVRAVRDAVLAQLTRDELRRRQLLASSATWRRLGRERRLWGA